MRWAGVVLVPISPEPTARLRALGLHVTRPRLAVLAVLDEAAVGNEHLTVAEVIGRVGAISPQSRQTTYDCLDALTAAGLARKIEPAGQTALYEGRVGDNHHHLVCRLCGQVTDLDCDIGSPPCIAVPDTQGFVIDEAEVVLWGRCATCASTPS